MPHGSPHAPSAPAARTRSGRLRWDVLVFVVALAALAWLFWKNTLVASRVIDGTRYYLLDDDMLISMRYARNLAEGHGLVWNPGERVEGYTNFLWTVVMAGVHLLPHSDANIALLVKAVNFAITGATLWICIRFVRLFAPRSRLVTPLLLVVMLTCVDVLVWSVWGFEVALLALLDVFFFYRLAQRRYDVLTFGALALIPLTRADGIHVFAGNALVLLALAGTSRRTLGALVLALVPTALHILFRHSYYGDWLPNTYYLKVQGLEHALERGWQYTRTFLLGYAVVLTLAAATSIAMLRTDRRGLILLGATLPSLGWVTLVGGDMLSWSRFLAHLVPLVFVFATVGVVKLTRGPVARLACAAVLFIVCVPLVRPLERLVFIDRNGDPFEQLQTAMIIRKNARPDSSVAVIAAGIVPYFTRLRAVDILGKSDRHVARLDPLAGAMVGHGKLDPEYTLDKKPDLVVSLRSHAWTTNLTMDERTPDPVLSFLASRPFKLRYAFMPIRESFTLGRTAIYTWPGSNEASNVHWKSVVVAP